MTMKVKKSDLKFTKSVIKDTAIRGGVGSRIFAISYADAAEVRLYGFGVRLPDALPLDAVGELAAHSRDKLNPCLKLDNGDILYGCECHWDIEEWWKQFLMGRKVVDASIVVDRALVRGMVKEPGKNAKIQ